MHLKNLSPLIAFLLPFIFNHYAFADTYIQTVPATTPVPATPAPPPSSVTTTVTNTPEGQTTTTSATTQTGNPQTPAVTSTTTVKSDGTVNPTTVITSTTPPDNTPKPNLKGDDDRTIRETIETKIAQQPLLAGTTITVISRGGDVVLSGNAHSQAQVDAAINIARSVIGVKNVRSDIVLQNP